MAISLDLLGYLYHTRKNFFVSSFFYEIYILLIICCFLGLWPCSAILVEQFFVMKWQKLTMRYQSCFHFFVGGAYFLLIFTVVKFFAMKWQKLSMTYLCCFHWTCGRSLIGSNNDVIFWVYTSIIVPMSFVSCFVAQCKAREEALMKFFSFVFHWGATTRITNHATSRNRSLYSRHRLISPLVNKTNRFISPRFLVPNSTFTS